MSDTLGKSGHTLSKEVLNELRDIDGFPLGKDEDIISLSDPPHYTACPNPWITEFIREHGKPYDPKTDSYTLEPFATDVSEGKNDPIYQAHTYHTKVPHKAIMKYLLHYTKPGDIVYDGFCGTGMTGVAAQMCANPNLEFKEQIEKEMSGIEWGARKAILNDLSPAATFIAYNYNTPVDVKSFEKEAIRILKEVEKECEWMYKTLHSIDGKIQYNQDFDGKKIPIIGKIKYTIWSDVFICPECSGEMIFWDVAVDKEAGEVKENFLCPHCQAKMTKLLLDRAFEQVFDEALNSTIKHVKQVPVLINYSIIDSRGKTKRFDKKPDEEDLILIEKIERSKIPYWYPTEPMMFKGSHWGDTWRAGVHLGISHVHHFYTKRDLWVISSFYHKIPWGNIPIRNSLLLVLTSLLVYSSKLSRWRLGNKSGPLSGTLYISSTTMPLDALTILPSRIRRIAELKTSIQQFKDQGVIFTDSTTDLRQMNSNSVDYIFTDPPFGGNLMYSELNFLWEAWLKVFTNNKNEAIVNVTQKKGLLEYQHVMEACFKEYYRVLKPGRWMTVEFHNSQNSVWMSIQEALSRAGFVVADVRTLDKKQGTFKQVTTTSAVKQDLIISAYKPNGGLEERFQLIAGTHEGVWDFVRQHLKHLPVISEKNGILLSIADRQPYLLFDRMVAFHVQRGVIVPISAGDFYAGLRRKFPERDGMYFLEDQVTEYDRKRMMIKKIEQEVLFVCDEKSSVRWLRKELIEYSDTLQNLRPKFMKELHQYKHEKLPELSELLKENFLEDSSGKWYVPDPSKEGDLIKVRERALLREFEEYRKSKGKLKLFRTEAIRAGFKKCWSENDYASIITIGQRLPSTILQEDDVLLMYYDNALTRQGITG